MNLKSNRVARRILIASVLLGLCATHSRSQETYSNIVGIIPLNIPDSSDVYFSFPMRQVAEYRGVVTSVAGGTNAVVSFDGTPFTASAFAKGATWATSYLLAESGAAQGSYFDIDANDASSVTLSGSDVGGLTAGDTVAIHPHWTLDKAFPSGVADVEDSEAGNRTLEVIVLRNPTSSSGVGMEAANIFYYHDSAWRWVESGLDAVAGGFVFAPGDVFVIRNNGEAALTAYFTGEVTEAPIAIPVTSKNATDYDNFVTISRPIPVALNELGLHDSGIFETTSDSNSPADLLMVYSLTDSGKNKSPTASYFYFNNGWRKEGASASTDFGTDTIEPGMGIAIRKQSDVDATQNWIQQWSLPQ